MLIDAGADVNAANRLGRTPVHIAARWGNPECLRILIDAGANLRTPSNNGTTRLEAARQSGNQECADMIEYKLDPRNNRPTKSASFRR
jgi:ankyrin repeat protein